MKINLKGYQITELLYDGNRTLVYRGIKKDEGKSVVIKTLHREYPNFNELLQFRHQYVLTKNLSLPGIVKPITLEKNGNGYVLIMEDVGGISLSEYLRDCHLRPEKIPLKNANLFCYLSAGLRGQTQGEIATEEPNQNQGFSWENSEEYLYPLDEFFLVGLSLVEILENLHQKRIIHKDIKPANILINPETKEIFLIDFSIASLLPKETQELQNPNQLEGTLAYISPEQTGRMNRGIDYRSDFYSLGVTFYELLTGQLPFESNDGMELVHCHIAKIPTPPHQINPEIPRVISDIVMKLMAKNAEDRYQSARGIRRDLERCWQQWQDDRLAIPFELGQRDMSDRFTIPEKLYGREQEVQGLLEGFDRIAEGNREMILVAGFSGIGKTVVVNEVHKPIVRQRGYFIKGKFDQFNRNIPFGAFVLAFQDLMGQLLGESDAQLAAWKEKILTALGENAQVIVEVIPELEFLIGKQPPVAALSGSAAQSRFNLLWAAFVGIFATKEHPLTIFLDDLQWADSASLNLLKLLMNDDESGYLLILGAYRDNEVFPGHPLMLALDELQKAEANITTITLAALGQPHLRQLVADSLRCAAKAALPLAELVAQKTKGNPFFATQFLKGLHQDGWITFNTVEHCWQCDLVRVRELALTDDVVEFMAGRLYKLPQKTQEVLKLAACIGNQFDLETLAVVCQQEQIDVAIALWSALPEGLVLPTSETYKFYQEGEESGLTISDRQLPRYKFLHDRVQQAAYSLIPEEQKQKTHYRIGKLLLAKVSPEAKEERIFELVNQLNYGTSLINKQEERDELAQLNLIACSRARAATAYQGGREYAQVGLSLLGENAWKRQYEMTLAFHDQAAELASLCGDFEAMEKFVEAVAAQAGSLLEKVNVYRIRIFAKVARNQLTEAIEIAVHLLQQLGVTLPESPTQNDVLEEMKEIQQLIGARKIEDLIYLPWMTDAEKIAIAQISNSIIPAAYIVGSPLLPFVICLPVKLSIQYGNTLASGFAYACYSIIACNLVQDVNTGAEFARLALQVAAKLDANDAKVVKPEAYATAALFGIHRREPIKETLRLTQEGYTAGLEVGNLDFAGRSAYTFCINAFWCGRPLTDLSQETGAYCNGLLQLKQFTTANYCRIYWQSILNLLEDTEDPSILLGKALQETELLPGLLGANDFFGLYFLYLYKLMLSYLFEEIESAENNAAEVKGYFMGGAGTVGEPAFYLYDSLTALAIAASPSQETLERVEQNQSQLQKYWAKYAPMNHQHKVDLVAAEKCRVLEQKAEAIELYDKAIAGAKKNEYTQEQALANELAAKFYLQWGKEKVAAGYMQDAYYCYAAWGAKAKINDLEQRYRQLLAPILRGEATRLDSRLTISHSTKETISSTTGAVSVLLDLSSTIKASLLVSGEIQLEHLLEKLMQVVMENAGATKGALILPREESLIIEAFADCSETVRITCVGQAFPLEETEELPISVINNVWRTQQILLFNDGSPDSKFLRDSYLMSSHPQSMLCIPLLNQGQLQGILYLENSLAAGAFTSDRLEVLNVICSQAAVSLENAQLYLNLEKSEIREREKSERLASSLQELKEAQLQLVQSEKMATIGQLVAGIAHEINNPVGFISGNLDYASEYIQNLINLLNLYRETFPKPGEIIEEEIEAIELDYLIKDLPQTINSMKEGTNRIADISRSMRTFSRSDTAEKVLFNLHDGIDSTLLILKHRLKANENRPEIQVVKNYGSLPEINCYPGQLNQVFMNLIANGIDALEEKGESEKNQITITTEIDRKKENVIVRIGDNGLGMSEEVKQKIFEHLFTTKKVGKGTGLGLSISRKIVEEKHGGKITCISEIGKGTEFSLFLPLS